MNLAELLALLPDNTTGQIGADDMRAIVETLFEGAPVGVAATTPGRAYGPSYKGFTGTALNNNFNIARRRLGSKSWNNLGVVAFTVGDMARFAYGSETYPRQGVAADVENYTTGVGTWAQAAFQGGWCLIDAMRNDAGLDSVTSSGGTTAKARASAKNSLDALIRMLRAETVTLASDASYVYTGAGWTPLGPITGTRIGTVRWTNVAGDKVVKTFTGDACDLMLVGCDDAVMGVAAAPFTAKLDGVNINASLAAAGYPTTTSNQFRKTLMSASAFTGPLAVPIRGAGAGGHTLEIAHAGVGGEWLMVDCDIKPSATPLTTIVEKVTRLTAAGYASYATLYGALGASAATDAIYDAIIDTVVARFPTTGSVDTIDHTALGFDPTTMISTVDNVHRNDIGELFIANNIFNKINSLAPRNGLVRTT